MALEGLESFISLPFYFGGTGVTELRASHLQSRHFTA
jgi:hypothetical protein